jgi:two-component system chemotaxis response regulator CheY
MNKKRLILVVDDDDAVLDTTCAVLEFFGYSVIQAKDGFDAISKYKKYLPGLVLLDIKMPRMDGYETFFELEEKFPDAKVIFMTAHVDYSKWINAKNKNALELIEKPYSIERLKELVEKFYPLT